MLKLHSGVHPRTIEVPLLEPLNSTGPQHCRGCAPLLLTSGFQPPRDSWSRAKLSHNSSNHPKIFGLWTHFTASALYPRHWANYVLVDPPIKGQSLKWRLPPKAGWKDLGRGVLPVPRQGMSYVLQGNKLAWVVFKGIIEFIRKTVVIMSMHSEDAYLCMNTSCVWIKKL